MSTPAWKKLGLKLKQPSDASQPSSGFGHPSSSGSSTHLQSATKRKFDAPPANSSQVAKRPRQNETTGDRNGQLKRQKSVTFADNPSTKKTTAKSKGPAKKQKPAAPVDLKPALEYLSLWKTARDSWKFKKNHQSNLIKHVFDNDGIPASNIETFYDYISDLNGSVRMRLKETAQEIRDQDQSDGGKGFPEGTKNVEAKQQQYETVLAKFLQNQPAGTKRKGFTEVDYLSDTDDEEVIIHRLVKRMRAELVIEELSDSDETEASTTSSLHVSETKAAPVIEAEKSTKPIETSNRRRRKLRTNVDSDTSSSDSSSDSDGDSDSDTSSSGSSDSESEDEVPPGQYRRAGDDTSSSSSSSEGEDESSDSDSD